MDWSSSLGDLETEKENLNDMIISGLNDSHMFKSVSGNKADASLGSGITIEADIKGIKRVSKDKRLWAGALAGRARISIQVTVFDLSSGHQIETFDAEGESSGGSALAGTTDEAVQRAADQVVREVIKLNALTAQ